MVLCDSYVSIKEAMCCVYNNLLVERLLVNSPEGCQGLPTFVQTDCSRVILGFFIEFSTCVGRYQQVFISRILQVKKDKASFSV